MGKPCLMSEMLFQKTFHAPHQALEVAHGRANLIGDHTDYNDGFVLPCLLTCYTSVCVSLRSDKMIHGISEEFGFGEREISDAPDGSWLDFITGATSLLADFGLEETGVNVAITSNVPTGAGLSSSAALEIALLKALIKASRIAAINDTELAFLAQKIEHDFIGTHCGIMDQMVIATATLRQAMRLDCRTLNTQFAALFDDACFIVIHSGISRKLSKGLYNQRLSECRQASLALGVESLRDITINDVLVMNNRLLQKRARHVASENTRVLRAFDALTEKDSAGFGALMTSSHASLKNDYEVSSAELDGVVSACLEHGALGARLTGAGFGGCIIALVRHNNKNNMLEKVAAICPNSYIVDIIT